jgi:hypothetical protein
VKLKPLDIEVPAEDPFRNDVLDRKACASALVELVKSSDESLVVGLDAEWGQGKSTFLRMLGRLLDKSQVKCLLFNAWESDFSENAFVSLLGELELGMAALKGGGSKARQRLNKVKKVSIKIIQRALPAAIKIATAGVVDLGKDAEGALADLAEKIAEERIKQYEAAKSSVRGFQLALAEFAKEVTRPQAGKTRSPLVIVIDELDRCRPSYAIEILETIKHFFSVPGVVFLIAADWTQLAAAARKRYGADMDVPGYLRRFVDITFMLPAPSAKTFCEAQFGRFDLEHAFAARTHSETRYDKNNVLDIFWKLFETTGCSLRDQERCFTLLSLAIRTTSQDRLLHPLFLAMLIVLKIKNSELFKEYAHDSSAFREVIEYFSSSLPGRELFEETHGYGAALEAYMLAPLIENPHDAGVLAQYQAAANDDTTPRLKERAKAILEITKSWRFCDQRGAFKYVLAKIDLVSATR